MSFPDRCWMCKRPGTGPSACSTCVAAIFVGIVGLVILYLLTARLYTIISLAQ